MFRDGSFGCEVWVKNREGHVVEKNQKATETQCFGILKEKTYMSQAKVYVIHENLEWTQHLVKARGEECPL